MDLKHIRSAQERRANRERRNIDQSWENHVKYYIMEALVDNLESSMMGMTVRELQNVMWKNPDLQLGYTTVTGLAEELLEKDRLDKIVRLENGSTEIRYKATTHNMRMRHRRHGERRKYL